MFHNCILSNMDMNIFNILDITSICLPPKMSGSESEDSYYSLPTSSGIYTGPRPGNAVRMTVSPLSVSHLNIQCPKDQITQDSNNCLGVDHLIWKDLSIPDKWRFLISSGNHPGLPETLRGHQIDTISHLLSQQNVVLSVPTGMGKTIPQLSTILLSSGSYSD